MIESFKSFSSFPIFFDCVFFIGLERVAQELAGRNRWKKLINPSSSSSSSSKSYDEQLSSTAQCKNRIHQLLIDNHYYSVPGIVADSLFWQSEPTLKIREEQEGEEEEKEEKEETESCKEVAEGEQLKAACASSTSRKTFQSFDSDPLGEEYYKSIDFKPAQEEFCPFCCQLEVIDGEEIENDENEMCTSEATQQSLGLQDLLISKASGSGGNTTKIRFNDTDYVFNRTTFRWDPEKQCNTSPSTSSSKSHLGSFMGLGMQSSAGSPQLAVNATTKQDNCEPGPGGSSIKPHSSASPIINLSAAHLSAFTAPPANSNSNHSNQLNASLLSNNNFNLLALPPNLQLAYSRNFGIDFTSQLANDMSQKQQQAASENPVNAASLVSILFYDNNLLIN